MQGSRPAGNRQGWLCSWEVHCGDGRWAEVDERATHQEATQRLGPKEVLLPPRWGCAGPASSPAHGHPPLCTSLPPLGFCRATPAGPWGPSSRVPKQPLHPAPPPCSRPCVTAFSVSFPADSSACPALAYILEGERQVLSAPSCPTHRCVCSSWGQGSLVEGLAQLVWLRSEGQGAEGRERGSGVQGTAASSVVPWPPWVGMDECVGQAPGQGRASPKETTCWEAPPAESPVPSARSPRAGVGVPPHPRALKGRPGSTRRVHSSGAPS